MTPLTREQMIARLRKTALTSPSMGDYFEVAEELRDGLHALLDIAEAVNNATQGMLSLYPEANDRATYLYFNGGGDVPVGQQVAVLPLAGEVAK